MINLDSILADVLEEYVDDVDKAVTVSVEQVATDAEEKLRTTGDYKDRTGEYRKSFTHETEETYRETTATIYSTKPQLTHLIERGHAIKGGTERTRKFPHWKPTEKKVIREAPALVVKNIEKIK